MNEWKKVHFQITQSLHKKIIIIKIRSNILSKLLCIQNKVNNFSLALTICHQKAMKVVGGLERKETSGVKGWEWIMRKWNEQNILYIL